MRVFSARDYQGMKNDGAILSITQDGDVIVVRPQVLRSLCNWLLRLSRSGSTVVISFFMPMNARFAVQWQCRFS